MALRPIPDPGVLKEADAFKQTAQMLNTCSESMMSVPTIVNAAFALELYLKSLNIEWQVAAPTTLGGKKAWLESRTALQTGHAPSMLYGALDQAMRNDLEQAYRERGYGVNGQTLEKTLQTYDGLFQDWRYVFEGRCKAVDLASLFAILAFFSEALNALPQRWAQQ
jgi:hypothetical protein